MSATLGFSGVQAAAYRGGYFTVCLVALFDRSGAQRLLDVSVLWPAIEELGASVLTR